MNHLQLTHDKLDVNGIMDLVTEADCGAISLFVGLSCSSLVLPMGPGFDVLTWFERHNARQHERETSDETGVRGLRVDGDQSREKDLKFVLG
jgi:hypothetical protein